LEQAGTTQAQYDFECREEERLNEADRLIDIVIDRDVREDLHDELRADREDLIGELAEAELFASDLPLSQIVARIAHDLGLEPDWHRLRPQDWDLIDHRTRADLKAGVTLGDAPPGWPKLPEGKTAPNEAVLRPPDG
jgi:hypothetical protein